MSPSLLVLEAAARIRVGLELHKDHTIWYFTNLNVYTHWSMKM